MIADTHVNNTPVEIRNRATVFVLANYYLFSLFEMPYETHNVKYLNYSGITIDRHHWN